MKKEIDLNKMKYFDVKVVKVRKGKGKYIKKQIIDGKLYGYYLDKNFNNILCLEEIKEKQPKGNWVNGENLDKIKFPCLCRYDSHGKQGIGIVTKGYNGRFYYQLHNIVNQIGAGYTTIEDQDFSIEKLIKAYDIHIRKGKIILFEEEK